MKRLDLITNIAVIVSSIALLGFLGNQWWERHHASQQPQAKALIGTTVHLPGVDFTRQSKTLLIVISDSSHFCQESEPFYRKLAQTAGLKTNLIAVLPVPQSEAENYVHSSIAPTLQVVSAPLNAVGVSGTPTLLLVDGHGKVEKAWIGILNDAGQKQVQSQL